MEDHIEALRYLRAVKMQHVAKSSEEVSDGVGVSPQHYTLLDNQSG